MYNIVLYFSMNFQMNLVLYSSIPLETQLTIAASLFSEIPNIEVWQTYHQQKPLDNHTGRIVIFKTELPHMVIVWQTTFIMKQSREKPEKLINYLLSHVGKGSLSNFLKRSGLATSITITSENLQDHFMYYFNVELTQRGARKTSEIVSVVFKYISKLRAMSPSQYRSYWIEHSKVLNINFDFFDEYVPLEIVK